MDKIYFHPYFTTKDAYFFILFSILFAFIVFYYPNYLGQDMAVSILKYCYNYDAICWNNLFLNITRILSAIILPYSVKIYLSNKDLSAGNQR
jgi:quinol-cytochrome oxidoreductase complex cytochrome b subunit